ncbi:hypothetical protein PENSPDRAFT_743060 [Peniophora sp. CONT]|nr:hypothetical protein PENSPDRAFT_743060 [Peniophora sp. CONT]
MNVFSIASRAAPLRRAPFALRASYSHLARPAQPARVSPTLKLVMARGAANQVGSRPGSQTFEHAGQNIKEEVGDAARDMAKSIAGGNYPSDSISGVNVGKGESFIGVTSAVAASVPKPYMVMGLAGGLPYLGAAATSVYLARQAGNAATGLVANVDPGVALTVLDQALTFQTTYGAVMLSFLGALHWGMEFSGFGGQKGYPRLLLGAAPVVFAWSTLGFEPTTALVAQWLGFTGLWYADLKATAGGWTPKWYSQYRFYLSILVGSCIIATLASTSYWSPHGTHVMMHDLQEVRAERKRLHPEARGVLPGGDVSAVPAPETEASGAYVILKKRDVEQEQEKDNEKGAKEGEESK